MYDVVHSSSVLESKVCHYCSLPPLGPAGQNQADVAAGLPGGIEEEDSGETHVHSQAQSHTLTASPSSIFFIECICCSGVLSEKDRSFYQQIRSLLRWSNYRYLRQRGSRHTVPPGIVWQSQIRRYLHLHIAGKTMHFVSHALSLR